MGICNFDYERLFCDEDWEGEWLDHHPNANSWARALMYDQCPICVALWQSLQQSFSPEDKQGAACGELSMVNLASSEQQRLDSISRTLEGYAGSWPFFRVRLRELANGDFLLNFQQFGKLQGVTKASRSSVAIQNFLCYPVDDEDDDLAYVGQSTGSSQAFRQIGTWVKQCDGGQDHAYCNVLNAKQKSIADRADDAFIPTRLIEIQPTDSPSVRLVADTAAAGTRGPYTTLSHCWGNPAIFEPLRLLENNLTDFCADIPWEELPQTFQDAISITKRLGVKYIWIDSLCILQGNEADWHTEAPRMERVYGNSYLNIAAVDSIDGRGGLFRPRRPDTLSPFVVNAESFLMGGRYRVVQYDFWNVHLLDMPLYRRGWVFQGVSLVIIHVEVFLLIDVERMLAPRILHFSRDQIFWQCLSLVACETSPRGLHKSLETAHKQEASWRRAFHGGKLEEQESLSDSDRRSLQLDETWKQAVHSYSSCNLTFSKDRLMALAGVANVMRAAFKEKYLAGLWGTRSDDQMWRSNLPAQLGWKVPSGKKANGLPSAPFDKYCAPSWSWASIDGVIELQDRFLRRQDYQATIIGVDVKPEQADVETGRVSSDPSVLSLRGIIITVPLTRSGSGIGSLDWHSNTFPDKTFWCNAWLDDGRKPAADKRENGFSPDGGVTHHSVLLLAFAINRKPMTPEGISGHGIIISPTSGPAKHYNRIGALEFRGLSDEAWQDLSGARDLKNPTAIDEDVVSLV